MNSQGFDVNRNKTNRCTPYSDYSPKAEEESGLGQRSISLTTLQPVIIQPRMAQLETLEAKMASIEVSLSNTPRRKKNSTLNSGASLRSIPKEVASKELENLRNALKDKENIIQNLKGQLTISGLCLSTIKNGSNSNLRSNFRELTDAEKRQAEERLKQLKSDVDNKRIIIKNLKMVLERLDITDNIDVRIQQAELEYQLGREELNLLTLLEETRTLQLCLEECNKVSESHTLFSCVNGNDQVILLGIEVNYDPKNPKFGAGQRDSKPGLWVDWALEETGMCKNDRLVEVNGKIILTKNRDNLSRLLAIAPDQAQIVLMRKLKNNTSMAKLQQELDSARDRIEEAQKVKDTLKSDNIKLTHRISYLEEQVADLLKTRKTEPVVISQKTPVISTVKTSQNVTNINITSQGTTVNNPKDLQVFQKGQVTTLVASLPYESPYRSKSSLSNVSGNTQISNSQSSHSCNKTHKHKYKLKSLLRHHNDDKRKQEDSVGNSLDFLGKYEKKEQKNIMDQSYKKAAKIVHDLTRNKEASLYEKHKQKCITASEKYNNDILKHYNGRKSTSVIDFHSEIHIGPKYYETQSVEDLIKKQNSTKSLDFDSDCNSRKTVDYTSEPLDNRKLSHYSGYCSEQGIKPRPTPPKKPLRLSLHKTQSLQTIETPLVVSNCSNRTSKNGITWKHIENGSWC